MNTEIESAEGRAVLLVSILQGLLKGFSVFYFLLLPILYAADVIGAATLGYLGALLIVGILVGALAVTQGLHTRGKAALLYLSLALLFGGTLLLFWPGNIAWLVTAYVLVGLATGLGMSTINVLAAQFTTKGRRYKELAKIAMLTDVTRIVYPLAAGAIFATVGFSGLVYFALLTVLGFAFCISLFARLHTLDQETAAAPYGELGEPVKIRPIRRNRPFQFVLGLEFLDSFASSQLFVFLPALLVFKSFSIENALFMQSAVFLGYLSGRWLVGSLAHRFNGFAAIGIAEVGMVVTIVFLLLAPASDLLYGLCFLLGLFSRGTAPVIKALAFDRLEPAQIRRGSALHVIGGDSGSALGQFVFGLLLAEFGVTAPFVGAAIFAGVLAVICFAYREPAQHLVINEPA